MGALGSSKAGAGLRRSNGLAPLVESDLLISVHIKSSNDRDKFRLGGVVAVLFEEIGHMSVLDEAESQHVDGVESGAGSPVVPALKFLLAELNP